MADIDDETWTTADLSNAIYAETPGCDAFVIRELACRMAEQLPGVRRLDPLHLALDLSHTLATFATIADTLIAAWMADLGEEERPEGAATLAGRLRECAADFRELSGSF